MHEIENDCFYDFVKQYDPDSEHHFVGEVDYHLLTDNKNYEVLQSHREALIAVFDHIHPLAICRYFRNADIIISEIPCLMWLSGMEK